MAPCEIELPITCGGVRSTTNVLVNGSIGVPWMSSTSPPAMLNVYVPSTSPDMVNSTVLPSTTLWVSMLGVPGPEIARSDVCSVGCSTMSFRSIVNVVGITGR